MIHFDFAEGLTLASGAVQAFLAAVFLRFMRARPHWGLGWLGLSYGLAAWLNLTAWYTMRLTPHDALHGPMQLASLLIGVTSMGALTAGVRLYMGSTRPGPWTTLAVVWALYILLIVSQSIWPSADLAMAGAALAALIFIYLAGVSLQAARREPRVGHGVAGAMLTLYTPMVGIAHQIGLAPQELNYWGSIPFTLGGLGLMAATMGRLRADLIELNESLESRVAHRTQDLQELVQGLESFNRMVSHDLKGPLGGMQGLCQVALAAIEQGDTARATRLIQAMENESGALNHLVGQLLELAKSTHTEIHKRQAALHGVVEESLRFLETSHGSGATRVVTCQNPLPQVVVDPTLLRQVLINLIGNALKFSSHASPPIVHLSAHEQDGGCLITVSDNGLGFDTTRQADLFKPFKRLHGDKNIEGSGVGLTIVHRIVCGHGGRVWAESRPGQGAQFHVWLPGT